MMLRRWFASLATAFAVIAASATAAAQTAPPPLEAYGELPSIEDAALSPRGERIALVGRVKGERRLLIMTTDQTPLRVVQMGDLKLRAIEWLGEETVLLTYSVTEKLGLGFTADSYEAYRAMIVPVDQNSEMSIVFANDRSIVGSLFGRYGIREIGGVWKGYFGAVELERTATGPVLGTTAPTLFEVELPRNDAKRLAAPASDSLWRDWLIGSDGKVAATFDMNRTTGEWTIRDSESRPIARGKNVGGGADLVTLGAKGDTLIYSARDEEENRRWYELPLSAPGTPTEIFADVGIDQIYIDRWSGALIGYRTDKTRVYLDPALQKKSNKIDRAFQTLHHNLIDWNRDYGRVLVQTDGNGDSGTWYLVDLTTLRAEPIGIERPLIEPDQVGKISSFAYAASDGLEMDGVLTVPPGREARNLPVVVFPHGGPSAHDNVAFDWWAQAFASRGYAVFQPNFRGSTNRDAAFMRAGNGEWGRKMQSDISDGLAALAAAGIVDPKRACIMGASYGGYAALAGVTLQQGLYRCAVAVAPVSDVVLMYDTNVRESGASSVVRHSLSEQLGPRSTLDDISPRRFADRADAPILLIHGREDTVVPFRHSQIMADALKDAGKPYRMVELRAEDHWLSRSETRKQMLSEAMAFVQKHNPAD